MVMVPNAKMALGAKKEDPNYHSETTERGNVIMLTVFRNDQILGSLTFFEHERDEVTRWEELIGKLAEDRPQ